MFSNQSKGRRFVLAVVVWMLMITTMMVGRILHVVHGHLAFSHLHSKHHQPRTSRSSSSSSSTTTHLNNKNTACRRTSTSTSVNKPTTKTITTTRRHWIIRSIVVPSTSIGTSVLLQQEIPRMLRLPTQEEGLLVAHAIISPIRPEEADSPITQMMRLVRPKPPPFVTTTSSSSNRPQQQQQQRPTMDRNFAVLLARSSYLAMEEINIIPMDQFQRDFFLIRAAEYQPYLNLLAGQQQGQQSQSQPKQLTLQQQGDLTNPYYFDFITFAQYLTINRILRQHIPDVNIIDITDDDVNNNNKNINQEDTIPTPTMSSLNKDELVHVMYTKVGRNILNKLYEIFNDTLLPRMVLNVSTEKYDNKPVNNFEEMLALFSTLAQIFVINGFALDAKVTTVQTKLPSSSSSSPQPLSAVTYIISLSMPANLWSGQSLLWQRLPFTNNYIGMVSTALANERGYQVLQKSIQYPNNNREVTYLTLIEAPIQNKVTHHIPHPINNKENQYSSTIQ